METLIIKEELLKAIEEKNDIAEIIQIIKDFPNVGYYSESNDTNIALV